MISAVSPEALRHFMFLICSILSFGKSARHLSLLCFGFYSVSFNSLRKVFTNYWKKMILSTSWKLISKKYIGFWLFNIDIWPSHLPNSPFLVKTLLLGTIYDLISIKDLFLENCLKKWIFGWENITFPHE